MILKAAGLSVRYLSEKGYRAALREVSFSVKEGEVLGIVGESGSGKSTFALSALGLLPAGCRQEGEVSFRGRNIFSLSAKELEDLRGSQIGLIFQEPASSFNPVLSIGYQFEEVLKKKRKIEQKSQRRKVIFDTLKKVRLAEGERIVKSYPHELSGGQLQRVAIAMAIALKPLLLIADEPTSSLDVTIESEIVHLLRELKEKLGLTVIFITHNLDLIKALADRVVVLYQGRVREAGDKEDVFAGAQDSYTKELLAAFRKFDR